MRPTDRELASTCFEITCTRNIEWDEFDPVLNHRSRPESLTVKVSARAGELPSVEVIWPRSEDGEVDVVFSLRLAGFPIDQIYTETLKQLQDQDWLIQSSRN
jgi:hypothetical protein